MVSHGSYHAVECSLATMNIAEFGVETRNYVTHYIEFADKKAGAVIGLVVAICGVIGYTANDFFVSMRDGASLWFMIAVPLIGIAAVCAAMTLFHALDALSPRLDTSEQSLASFPDIAGMAPGIFVSAILALDQPGIARELAMHNAVLSRVAHAKFKSVADAVWWLRGLLFGAYTLLVVYGVRLTTLAN